MRSKSQSAATEPRNVAHAIVSKNEDVFVMSEHGGGIPAGNEDGFGIYYHDCRYLDGYEIYLAGVAPNPLVSYASQPSRAAFELTNGKLQLDDETCIQSQTFGLSIERTINSEELVVSDLLTIENYDVVEHELPLTLKFHSGFEDIFVIRGLHPKKVGEGNKPKWQNGVLVLSYNGADGVSRRVEVQMHPKPNVSNNSEAHFDLKLGANSRQKIEVALKIVESRQRTSNPQKFAINATETTRKSDLRAKDWLEQHADIQSDNPILDKTVRRCLLDLLMLTGSLEGHEYFSAGIPWYGTLFGRDSIIAALETLAFEPHIAEQTIRLLARKQGTHSDEWRDEEPGKILHELRRGELANLNEIPQTPYYGSVDSTPLFLILIGEHARWTGDLSLFQEIREHVEHALQWIDHFGADKDSGFLCYAAKSKKGLNNQGWKDSHDAIMNADGSLATPPIALSEVQGYAYLAKTLIADLVQRCGEHERAESLRREAQQLKENFNRDFWLESIRYYAMALQKENRPAAVVGSNPGQALWTGIIDESKASAVVNALMSGDMFSGWGIRTLSMREKRANPVGYHLGSVWPHDNAIIASGLRRYGFDQEAIKVLDGILEAASLFEHMRLPEVFAGYSRKQFPTPVRYPVACHPQAWAAGSVPFMLTSVLGIIPDAFEHKLWVSRPVLPSHVSDLHFRRIKLGKSTVDLHFRRDRDGTALVDVHTPGDIQVTVREDRSKKAA